MKEAKIIILIKILYLNNKLKFNKFKFIYIYINNNNNNNKVNKPIEELLLGNKWNYCRKQCQCCKVYNNPCT